MKKFYSRYAAIALAIAFVCISIVGCSKDSNPTSDNTTPSITIKTPAAGAVITQGTQNYQITWATVGVDTAKTLEYSSDNGTTWSLIADVNAKVNSYGWNVPTTATTKGIIRITDKKGLSGSSGVFTISSGSSSSSLTVVTPRAGEVIPGGTQNYQISWTGTGIAAQKTLEYSIDNGATWNPIDKITSSATTYSWTVPSNATATAIVRITDQNNLKGSSGVFTISGLPVGEMDATVSGTAFKALNAKAINQQLVVTVKGSLEKYNNKTLDSVSLTLVVAKQGAFPYTIDLSADDNSQVTFCIVNPTSGTCLTSYTAKKGFGSGMIKITSLTPIIEGTFSGTLVSGTNTLTITNGAFKAQLN